MSFTINVRFRNYSLRIHYSVDKPIAIPGKKIKVPKCFGSISCFIILITNNNYDMIKM